MAVLAEPVDITGARRRLDLVRAQPGTAGEELEEPRSFGVEAVADVEVDAIHLQRSQVELGGVDDHRHILGALPRPGTELAEVPWALVDDVLDARRARIDLQPIHFRERKSSV